MNTNKIKSCVLLIGLFLVGCNNVLDLEPTDRLTANVIFGDPKGVETYMANLYSQLPIEDFTFMRQGFNYNQGGPNNGGQTTAIVTDEAIHSESGSALADADYQWWSEGYRLMRDVNILVDAIPLLKITEQEKKALTGESSFIKAFTYFGLAKRYGGVSLIKNSQEYNGDAESLKVPRSTEQETWDYVLSLCDIAIANLSDVSGGRRASKWAAYALKSRAALHAASLAKFGNLVPMSGDAVTQKLVGLDASLANKYYAEAISASEAIISSGKFQLFKPTPANPKEAAENYRLLFQDPNANGASIEAIFIKGRALVGDNLGHNYDIWFQPAQVANGWPHPGRMNPTLDLADTYESYTKPGQSDPIVTTMDNITTDYNGFNPAQNYIRFNSPNEIFKDKDARLWATSILPGTIWKNTPIIIQAGYVKPDGAAVIRTNANITINGTTYYTYGASRTSLYSGFDSFGGNNTKTGFSFKKFMNELNPIVPSWNQSTSDWMEFRYAEILLNYAEAVVESGTGNATTAATALNATRKRAGHTVDIPLTVANVQRERRVELAFENKRFWDLIRRREYHVVFNNTFMKAIFPILDLRALPAIKYIFVRQNAPNVNQRTFITRSYYRSIPGIGANGLIQNPQY